MRERINWVVSITDVETSGDVQTVGPYTKTRAQKIAASLQEFFERGPQDSYKDPLVSSYPLEKATITTLKSQWSEYGPERKGVKQ